MGKKFVISENDKRHIMSLYGILSEETANLIFGKVVSEVFLDGYFLSMYEKYTVGIKNLKISLGYFGADGSGTFTKVLETTTDEEGNFKFEKVPFRTEYSIIIPETDTFDQVIKKIKITQGKDLDTGNIIVTSKKEVPSDMISTDTDLKDPCGEFESSSTIFYGRGNEEVKTSSKFEGELSVSQSILDALTSIVEQYFEKFQIDESLLDSALECLEVKEVPFNYEIVCNQIISLATTSFKYVVVKADIKDITKFLQECSKYSNKEIIEPEKKIEFEDYKFIDALNLSYDTKRKIFMLVGLSSDENTNKVLEILNKDPEMVDSINKNYINLYYQVDRGAEDKYYIASEFLDMESYPSIYIIEVVNDPNNTELRDSIKIIKRLDGVSNNLESLDTLDI